jgi:hypothetical protein
VPLSTRRALKAEDDAKLIFGTVFSLRRMARQLGGGDDHFLSYRTGEYKLHYFETPTQLKFVLLTDTRVGNMRTVLHQIWATLYVEYVVKSPLAPIEHPKGLGVANELFEGGLETFMVGFLGVMLPRWTSSDLRLGFHFSASTVNKLGRVPRLGVRRRYDHLKTLQRLRYITAAIQPIEDATPRLSKNIQFH